MKNFLFVASISTILSLLVGCTEEKWTKTQLAMDKPLSGPCKVMVVAPEKPQSGMQTILVESINGGKDGKTVQSYEEISSSLHVKAGDYVRIIEGRPFNMQTEEYEKRKVRLVSIDLNYSAIVQAERRQALESELVAIQDLEQAKTTLTEEVKALEQAKAKLAEKSAQPASPEHQ
jgi:hypothetical protein